MNFITANAGWIITLTVLIVTQLIIYGNLPKRVDSLEVRMSTLERSMNENLRDHATIIANQAHTSELLQRLLDLHTKA